MSQGLANTAENLHSLMDVNFSGLTLPLLAPPPDTGESPEITALSTNLSRITDAVTAGGSPQWFADCLVERAFVTREAASGIHGVTISKLMDSVFAKIRQSEKKSHLFHEFVDIFSHDKAYAELVERLRRKTDSTAGKAFLCIYALAKTCRAIYTLWFCGTLFPFALWPVGILDSLQTRSNHRSTKLCYNTRINWPGVWPVDQTNTSSVSSKSEAGLHLVLLPVLQSWLM